MLNKEGDSSLCTGLGEFLIQGSITVCGCMTFKAKSQLRVLVEDFGEIVKHELGIVAQISLADDKFGRIEVLFDLFNLLYIQSIADNDYLSTTSASFLPKTSRARRPRIIAAMIAHNQPGTPFFGFGGT